MQLFARVRILVRSLRRRKMGRWGAAYLAAAWLVLQVLALLAEAFDWPMRVVGGVAILCAYGLPAVLIVAWYHGEKGQQRVLRREIALLAGIAVVAMASLAFFGGSVRAAGGLGAATLVEEPASAPLSAVAVLPFEDLTPAPDDSYFTEGIHEEILTRLARVGELQVTSRVSVLAYDGPVDLATVGRDLGVGTVLEGSVRRADGRVRIAVRLIVAESGRTLWAQSYDRALEDIFTIQTEVATRVVSALQARLSAEVRERLAHRPTGSPAAFDLYLRARALVRLPGFEMEDLAAAQRLLEGAVAEDSAFALGWAELGSVHTIVYRFALDPSPERIAKAREAIGRALQLDPSLPEGHVALGYLLYQADRDYDAALREFQAAAVALPSDAGVAAAMGYIRRRQGRWEDAVEGFRRAGRLDPLNPDYHYALATTYRAMRRYAQADESYRRIVTLSSEGPEPTIRRGLLFVHWQGRTDTLRSVLSRIGHGEGSERIMTGARYQLAMMEGRPRDALGVLSSSSLSTFDGPDRVRPVELLRAWAHELHGDENLARLAYEDARHVLELRARERPDDARVFAALGLAYAGLGRAEEAMGAGLRALRLEPEELNRMYGPTYAAELAAVMVRLGDTTAGLREVRRLLDVTAGLSAGEVLLDPLWAPLREVPGFREELRRELDRAGAWPSTAVLGAGEPPVVEGDGRG